MKNRVCVFGEVLFDHFSGGTRVLGGAPFNVAWHLQAFRERPLLISRVGDDSEGNGVKAAMQQWGMDTSALQTDKELPTGKVNVSIEDGEPSYEIVHPAAWDAIQAPSGDQKCQLLYHGSLALRSESSRRNWQTIRSQNIETVFVDVNLRPPWCDRNRVEQAISGADWVKLNGLELEQLSQSGGSPRQRAFSFVRDHELKGLVLTEGADGASVLTASGETLETRPACGIVVKDTVGAGDSLAAVFILGLVRGWDLQATLDRAQAFASALVGQTGATVHDPAFYTQFTNAWNPGSS